MSSVNLFNSASIQCNSMLVETASVGIHMWKLNNFHLLLQSLPVTKTQFRRAGKPSKTCFSAPKWSIVGGAGIMKSLLGLGHGFPHRGFDFPFDFLFKG